MSEDGWRAQKRFGKSVLVPPMEEFAELIRDPAECYIGGRSFYSGAVIDTLVLGGWPVGTRFRTGGRIYEVGIDKHTFDFVLVQIETPVN